MTHVFRSSAALLAAATTCLLIGCGGEAPAVGPRPLSEVAPPVIEGYATLVHATYVDAHEGATKLGTSLDALVAQPSAASLEAAKSAWLAARDPYGQSESFRFYGGPVDDDDGPEGRINAWPMDEAYVDYVEGEANAGIINDPATYPTIDEALIASLNEQGGEKNISSGYHAIEFLLWGQDMNVDGPGARPFTDYVMGAMGTAENQDRRGAYLTATSKLLSSDLASLVAEWAPESGAYRKAFVALPPEEALRRMLLGMGSLSGAELAGERMQVAYDTKEQEDEHSCFSDNTHADLLNNARAIQNVYLGKFGDVDVPGIDELVRGRDPALDVRMQSELAASIAAIEAITAPFDQAILGDDAAEGRKHVAAAIASLRKQTTTIVAIADLFEIKLNLEE
ncbi:imelysin family protein [Polyangium aurulentum]|uniref:imelysin family protein n=1 Tax=Polyangium aurulentum TaxID=2567896 RepID=UPI0010AE3151|nr:imelysin family protein [Polyangium aurulentum]UQA62236.1 iron-regulated protein [Polyangium aurulentum]